MIRGLSSNHNQEDTGQEKLDLCKFTTGTPLTTPEAGVFEFDGERLYWTNVAIRRAIDATSDVVTSTTTVTNTVTETTVFTGTLGANAMKTGNVFNVDTSGIITNATAAVANMPLMYL